MGLLLSLIGFAIILGGGWFLYRLIRANMRRKLREAIEKDAKKLRDGDNVIS